MEGTSARRLRRLMYGVAVVAVAGVGIWHLSRPEPVAVATTPVASGPVEATVANTRAGTVKACRRAGLSPLVGGQVAELKVTEGDRVHAGERLLSLWNEDLEARMTLDRAQAEAADAQAEQACLVAEEAQREAARKAGLAQKGIATEEQYDKAATAAKAQKAACRAAREAAKVAAATVKVTQAELDRTRLSAPFDGVVAEVNAELYEFVTPSPVGVPTPPAVDLIDDACLFVSAPIDEVDAPSIRAGLPVRVTVDALPGRSFPGTVRRVAPYVLDVEKQARTVEVEVSFDHPREVPWLLPGQTADVEVILERKEGALRVPTAAVLEGNRVLVLADGELVARDFTPGLANWAFTEVDSGLAPGEAVVTSLERDGVVAGAAAVADSDADAP